MWVHFYGDLYSVSSPLFGFRKGYGGYYTAKGRRFLLITHKRKSNLFLQLPTLSNEPLMGSLIDDIMKNVTLRVSIMTAK